MAAMWTTAGFAYAFSRLAMGRGVVARARADDPLFGYSFAWLGVGIAALLPLSVHVFIMRVLGGAHRSDIASWVLTGVVLTAAAHVALAAMTARRALTLASGGAPRSLGSVFARAVAWGCFPGVVFFALPSMYIALTGLAVLPVLHLFDRALIREREQRLARGHA